MMTADPDAARGLRGLCARLDAVQTPTEQAFLRYGEVLTSAVTALRQTGEDFQKLAARLSGDDTRHATGELDNALRQVMALAARQGGNDAVLGDLETRAGQVSTQVNMLRKTVGEVAVLAMNAKIQASHVTQAGVDFSVFTVEIARLGNLALASIDQTAARLVRLRQSIQRARAEGSGFERRNAAELSSVHARVQQGLKVMEQHRHDAATATAEAAESSADVAGRIGAAIGKMQINDIAAQRIAHVSTALGILADLLDDDGTTHGDENQWLAQMEPERRRTLAGTVLRLQSTQLTRTRDEFRDSVAQLAQHMTALSADAGAIARLAARTYADEGGRGASFVAQLEQDMIAARDLLNQTEQARAVVRKLTESMVADFESMASDLRDIQSIDADMRIMGLNATLKCGRLGTQGRALGVIAQELRGCSKRTEELARRLSTALAEAMDQARSLTGGGDDGRAQLSQAAAQALETSLQALETLNCGLEPAFTKLHDETDGVASRLARTAQGMDVGRDVGGVLDQVIVAIDAMAARIDPDVSDPRGVRLEVEKLLQGHYTMDSERLVHELFADGTELPAPVAAPVRNGEDVDDFDDCFL